MENNLCDVFGWDYDGGGGGVAVCGERMEVEGQRRRLVICTTGVVSGRSVMERVVEKGIWGRG